MAKEDSPSQLLAECSKGCGRSAAPGWKTCCRRCSDGKTHHSKFCQQEPFRLLMFGSRRYGAALPSSDIDLVLSLPWDARLTKDERNIRINAMLEHLCEYFGSEGRITDLQPQLGKSTICFEFASTIASKHNWEDG